MVSFVQKGGNEIYSKLSLSVSPMIVSENVRTILKIEHRARLGDN